MVAAGPQPPRERKLGYEHAGVFARVTYTFVNPLIKTGLRHEIGEDTAQAYLPRSDHAEALAAKFDAAYAAVQSCNPSARPASLVWLTFWRLYKWRMLLQLLWTLGEVAVRVGSPVIMRQLLNWLTGNQLYGNETYPVGHGWMWAGILSIMGYLFAIIHHQLFWVGMRMGFCMRLQAIAAVQAKVLRLNSVAVADVSPGKVVNLVSNDVARLDNAATFWNFLICGPLELLIVLVLVGLRLGFPASVAGVATLLLLIPAQGFLVKYIGGLRTATAAQTDERVRLTNEAIDSALACKMMCWEDPMLARIHEVRAREAKFIRRINIIRACNMALSYCMSPLVSLITFAVARATSRELSVANVFYALALLALPRVYMAEFFVHGVEFISEVRVSIRRIGAFLHLPEPPAPVHAQQAQQGQAGADGPAVAVNGADFDWDDRSWVPGGGKEVEALRQKAEGGGRGVVPAAISAAVQKAAADGESKAGEPAGRKHEELAIQVQTKAAAAPNEDGSEVAGGKQHATHPTLKALRLEVQRGQLVAIVGEVGAGKSSVVAALLGELQPIAPAAAAAAATTEAGAEAGAAAGQSDSAQDGPGQAGQRAQQAQQGDAAVVVRGRVAYCSQVPWIVSGSFKENVLFGTPYDAARYAAVLDACALRDDIAALPAGDETELGERGINLSGGQKARLALARAAYSQAAVQLLDDPLSAVDPRVGRILFSKCIGPGGVMEGTTRLLVTHQRQYLPSCDMVLVMEGGRIVARGTYAQLAAQGLPQVVAAHETELDDATYDSHTQQQGPHQGQGDGEGSDERAVLLDDAPEESTDSPRSKGRESSMGREAEREVEGAAVEQDGGKGGDGAGLNGEGWRGGGNGRSGRGLLAGMSRRFSLLLGSNRKGSTLKRTATAAPLRRFLSTKFGGRRAGVADASQNGTEKGDLVDTKSGRLIVGEDRATGSVELSIYRRYFSRMGTMAVLFIGVSLLVGQAAYLLGDYWLARWASQPPAEQQRAYWVWGYAIFASCITVLAVSRSLVFFSASLRASTRIHDAMVERVLRSPLSFFHTNPTGRVLNRFSRDLGAVDELLPQCMFDAVQSLMMVLGAFVLLCVVVPVIIPIFIPLGLGFLVVRRRYLATSRDVKRFEAVTRSPVYSSLSAILKGLPTIRAYSSEPRFRAVFLGDLSRNGAWWFSFLASARWIGFRLDMLVAFLMTAAPLLMMAWHTKLQARLAGLALTQSLQLGGLLQWMVRQTAEVENHMTSVERMLHYTTLDQEPPTVARGGAKPPGGWPSGGSVCYQDVTAIYRPGLPPVLRDLTFTIPGGASCGVVGRTGSGKSSLMLTLFRLIPITDGTIWLDNVDTSTLGLDALRRQVAIIPQDPVLFSGTLRSNLDPWGQFEDARLWEVLQMVQLGGVVSGAGGLDSRMAESGHNLSVGQRQLFCLARALLQEAAILALDEATANVDRTTDALIQQAVHDCCAGAGVGRRRRTLLVIAHRIDTIMDCEQLLVLGAGRLVEAGAPGELVRRQGGVFARLVAAAQDALQQRQGQHGQGSQ